MRKGWDAQLSRRNSQKKERDADRSEYMQVGSMHGERLANTCVAFIHARIVEGWDAQLSRSSKRKLTPCYLYE